ADKVDQEHPEDGVAPELVERHNPLGLGTFVVHPGSGVQGGPYVRFVLRASTASSSAAASCPACRRSATQPQPMSASKQPKAMPSQDKLFSSREPVSTGVVSAPNRVNTAKIKATKPTTSGTLASTQQKKKPSALRIAGLMKLIPCRAAGQRTLPQIY